MQPDRSSSYRAFFADAYADALRFAQRRSSVPDRAEDAVADAMLVAWRRFDSAPAERDERRAWLFGIVRNTLLNTARSDARQSALAVRLADTFSSAGIDDHASQVAQRVDLARAWSDLEPTEQEVIALAVFEQLTATQAALVLGISAVAFRKRLARARRALDTHLNTPRPSPTTVVPQGAGS